MKHNTGAAEVGRILVTGATGFLGRRVCQFLAARSVPFLAIARQHGPLEELIGDLRAGENNVCPAGETVDLRDYEQVTDIGRRWPSVDRIVHLASPVPGPGAATTDLLVGGGVMTLHLLSLLEQLRVRHVTFISSVAVYGYHTDQPMGEDASFSNCPTPYGLMKQLGERTLEWFARDHRFRLAVLRPSQIFGPAEPHGLGLTRMVRVAASGQPIILHNGGSDQRDLIFVDDVARAVVQAVEREAHGTFNISAGQGYAMRDVAEHIAAAVGVLGAVRVIPGDGRVTRFVYPHDRARRELGFQPATKLEDGIRETVAWAISHPRAAA